MGKGDTYRKVDRGKWDEVWRSYCESAGHRFKSNICVYCGKVKNEAHT